MNCDIIKLLPDSVANQIAAGEVIQRPASVIKELVENAVDAGATSIEIIVKDAGRTLIQVVDNGSGMTPTDARMAFERHATSKITDASDLYALHTMGFRGEALPSIAAVAQIELRTMTRSETVGTRLQLSESKFVSQEPCACAPGTNIMVKNIFFNMPARRKFLKKDSVELSHIMHEFERLALVNTNVEFTFINNGVTQYKLLRGNLKERITSLLGKAIGSQIIPVSTQTSIVSISGFVGLPSHARRRGAPQYFFVNGRNMRHPYFHKAIAGCYADLIASDMQPIYFINIEVDPSTIDVNIHPQKHEIKFENEQPIWQILSAAVKQSLGKINAAGAIDFDSDDIPDIPVFLPDKTAEMPSISTDDEYNPFEDTVSPASGYASAAMPSAPRHAPADIPHRGAPVPRDWDKLYESFTSRRDSTPGHNYMPDEIPAGMPGEPEQPTLVDVPQAHNAQVTIANKYVVLPVARGMMVIDRYRAHVRVLYDRFISSMTGTGLASQKLIFPESVTLTPVQSTILSSALDAMTSLGYDLSFLGDGTWAVNAVPAIRGNAIEILVNMIDDLGHNGTCDPDSLIKPTALAMARAAAISPGHELTDEETDVIVAQLLASAEGAYTPDGNPTYTILDTDAIQKLIK